MKTSLIFLSLLLCAGCQTASPLTTPEPVPPVAKTAPVAAPPAVAPAGAELEHKLTQQARLMAALIEQNDVLAEKLRAAERSPTPAANPTSLAPTPLVSLPLAAAPVFPTENPKPELPLHVPNADGLIDLSVPAGPPGAPVNPFALRSAAAESPREITLLVQGIAAGPNACALINERTYEAGDTVESLRVDRIDPDAVILRGDGYRLRIPPTEKPVRVRLPL
ncbi:MAG: hypothetical protein PHQ04_04010 [Opitutaceae bacterium]|nr:hypothetical protein [Opitutaceae bacterium]